MISEFLARSELTRRLSIFRKEFLWVGVFSLIANILMLTPTLYMLQVYDRVLVSQSELTLLVLTVILVFFFSVMAFAEWLRSRLLVRVGVRIDEELNSLVFNASFDAYLRNARRNIVEVFSDLTRLRQFLTGGGILAFFDIPWTPIYIAVIFLLHPLLGWISVLFALVQLGVTYRSHRMTVSEIELAEKAGTDSTAYLQSKLRNIEPVHAMGMAGNLQRRWQDFYDQALDAGGLAYDKQQKQRSFVKFARYTMQSLTLGVGALLVIEGKLSPSAMVAGNVLMARALQPLDLVVSTWKSFIESRMAFLRLETLLTDYPERAKGSLFPAGPGGGLQLDGVTATVPVRDAPILDDLSLTCPAGSTLVVLGPSGSGKSTLARCILGIWPDVRGRVLIGGEPVESWDREALGPSLGYLPQDIELFEGTIAENISRFAEVDPEKVIEAAMRTGIHEMILRFPQGYDTQIGEGGSMLSAGQRQRIGLARALHGTPALVVLDEPNANLDEAGERSLVQTVRELREMGRTVVLITHRPAVLALADLVLIMDRGKVMQFGPRETVIAALRSSQTAAVQPQQQG